MKPGEKKEYILFIGTGEDKCIVQDVLSKYGSMDKTVKALEENKRYWNGLAEKVAFESGLKNFSEWMRWISLQPVFRKIYGCSFLPYHDYGKGGRGWRDLWQDCLSLILQDPSGIRSLLINNFAGVRVDGTNATIIGNKPGEFIADRNNIARVWMDHGVWPYLTTRLYIDQSGDFGLLMERQSYFCDALIFRSTKKNTFWSPEQGVQLKTQDGCVYEGTLLEHILVQHLTSFFNVGEHNMIRLEGADWNDTLDMARERGESTAFTALYGSNLLDLADLIEVASEHLGIEALEFFEEIQPLLDGIHRKADYGSIDYKRSRLSSYLKSVSHHLSGRRITIGVNELLRDLRLKGQWIFEHIRSKEFITTSKGDGFFNGYYNNEGDRVDGEFKEGVRMNLTAQVFTTMFGLATKEQVRASNMACKKYLVDPVTGGYRLNTPLGPNKLNFGRGFAFAYGEKENGATFSHMAVMYMNALYRRHFVKEGYQVFKSLFVLSNNTAVSGIYPGIPEYFNASGKGLYHYLTGSASWLLLTVLTQMYGVRGEYGDLVIEPKLVREQFNEQGKAQACAYFRGKALVVNYINPKCLEYGQYRIEKVQTSNDDVKCLSISPERIQISGNLIETLDERDLEIDIILGERV